MTRDRLARVALSLSVGLGLAGCGGARPEPAGPAGSPVGEVVAAPGDEGAPPAVAGADLSAYAGRYAIHGEVRQDGCGGAIVWVTEHIDVDAAARTVHADVVDWTLPVTTVDGAMSAEGRFPADEGACPSSTTYVRAVVQPADAGRLVGTVESVWQLPPECGPTCRVVFDVVATPLQ